MKEKIISKAKDMFISLGFKSITMDDIACEMCISKKTIYKYFANKEILVEESTKLVHEQVEETMHNIAAKNYNAIEENFQLKRTFKEIFKSAETSPIYQLKKHYPEIYSKAISNQIEICQHFFRQNIEKGILEGFYRKDIHIENYVTFYYTLIFSINETISSEREAYKMETEALEYHTRAMATAAGIIELEKNLSNLN
jgi:AcrR family transcriptional regulator